jgi:hypothetical protein
MMTRSSSAVEFERGHLRFGMLRLAKSEGIASLSPISMSCWGRDTPRSIRKEVNKVFPFFFLRYHAPC